MEQKPTLLDKQTQKHIQEMSESMADKLLEEIKPDPDVSKARLKKKLQAEVQSRITEFFERFVTGAKELVVTLVEIGKTEPGINSKEILAQFDKIGAGLASMGENFDENASPKEICGISDEMMQAFNRAVKELYEAKQYKKASAVYSFLSFLNPDEPAYWLGLGNCEFFSQRYDQALQAYEAASIMDPADPHCHFYAAHCYHELDQIDKAIESCDKALEVIINNHEQKEWQAQAEQLKSYFNQIAASKKGG